VVDIKFAKMNKLKLKRLIYRIQHDYLTLNNVVIAAAILIAMSWAWGSIESMQKNYELQRSIDNKRQQVEIEKLQVALLEYESKYYQSEESEIMLSFYLLAKYQKYKRLTCGLNRYQ